MKRAFACTAALALGAPALASPGAAPVLQRIRADEARQGAASDGRHVYAVDNSRIGKYRVSDGRKVAFWQGDPKSFPHLNSCSVADRELVCAASNYPALPQTSRIEFFDRGSLRHLRSQDLGATDGSLTAIERHNGAWWAVFAQYDGRGGAPGRDHRATRLARLDSRFRPLAQWTLPARLLDRLKPYSVSGASWGPGGLLALSGHDRPEVYLVRIGRPGSAPTLVQTVAVATNGQAIGWDKRRRGALWSISRRDRELVLSDLRPMLRRR